MTTKGLKGWVVGVSVATGLWAQEDPGQALLESLYGKLAASFTPDPAQGGEFLILATPGFPVTAAMTGDPYPLSVLADQVPRWPIGTKPGPPKTPCSTATGPKKTPRPMTPILNEAATRQG